MKAASTTNKILPWQWFALFVLLIGLMGAVILLFLAVFNLVSPKNTGRQNTGYSMRQVSLEDDGAAFITATPFQPQPSFTPTLIPSFTPTFTFTPTVTPTASPFPTETPVPPPTVEPAPASDVASEYQIGGIAGFAQLFTLDCESRSAVDWANFLGVSIDQMEFLNRLPESDNPDFGFVGNYYDEQGQLPPNSYGVHAAPVADLLNEYGVNATARSGATWHDIQVEISNNRPVIAWVVNHVYPGYPVEYTDSQGRTTTVARFEHTVIVTGYDNYNVTILDGDMVYYRTIPEFYDSWSVLGYMMITYNP